MKRLNWKIEWIDLPFQFQCTLYNAQSLLIFAARIVTCKTNLYIRTVFAEAKQILLSIYSSCIVCDGSR
jgi:hypothetical protein